MPDYTEFEPLRSALIAVAQSRDLDIEGLGSAWDLLQADLEKGVIAARCRARRYNSRRGRYIDKWESINSEWFPFLAHAEPWLDYLRFDVAAARGDTIAGVSVPIPPEHARDVAVDAVRRRALYPEPVRESEPAQLEAASDPKIHAAIKRLDLDVQQADTKPPNPAPCLPAITMETKGNPPPALKTRTRARYKVHLNGWLKDQDLKDLTRQPLGVIAESYRGYLVDEGRSDILTLLPKRLRSMEGEIERHINGRPRAANANKSQQRPITAKAF